MEHPGVRVVEQFRQKLTESYPLSVATLVCIVASATWAVMNLLLRLRGLLTGWHPRKVLLVDMACFRIPERLRWSRAKLMEHLRAKSLETDGACMPVPTMDFMEKLLKSSGMGDEAGLSDAVVRMLEPGRKTEGPNGAFITLHKDNLEETEMVLFKVVDQLLAKTGLLATDIDAVVTSCSCFAPTPSMAAMIVNKFKMRTDVITYSLAGMGCSSSLVAVDMVKHLLNSTTMRNSRVLVVNHENITNCWYNGLDKSMALVNCLFRVGGAAVLFSNRPEDAHRAKYELLHCNRTHLGCQDDAFSCMGNGMDDEAKYGVFLRRNVVEIAGRAMRINLRLLAPYVLPYTELVRCLVNKKYTPAFNKAFDHFLLHTGGRGVLDEIERSLNLSPKQMIPAKDTLFRFGNTSSASTWYILSYIETTAGVKRGAKIWQLGFGGGFKCHSAVWRARRTISEAHDCWT